MSHLAFIALIISLLYASGEAQRIVGRRGLGGNLGLVNCPSKTFPTYPTIPNSYDLRTAWPQCMTPILNQDQCGCCWAFAAAQTLTERFCIQSNNTVKRMLSPQDMIQCDKTCQYPLLGRNCNSGCNGGYLDNAWVYLRDTGVVGWTCVPYLGSDGTCPATKCDTTKATKYYSTGCYKLGSALDIQAEILLNGPVEAGFTVYDDFTSYTSGVYVKSSSTALGGHAVRLIGWGSENGVDFWIAANQWSSDWGDKGYFKIRRGTDECGIESTAIAGMADLNQLTTREYEEYRVAVGGAAPTAGGSAASSLSMVFVSTIALMTLHVLI